MLILSGLSKASIEAFIALVKKSPGIELHLCKQEKNRKYISPSLSLSCMYSECLDGNVTCFEDFVPNVEGELNATQLNQLSHLLKQFFYFENNHKDSILSNIRDIARIISDSEYELCVVCVCNSMVTLKIENHNTTI